MIQERNVYLEFLDHLNAVGVRYAVLHDWEFLAGGRTSDVDIIVAADDLQRLEASLRAPYRILNMFQYEASGFGFVLAPKDYDVAPLFVADLATDYRWGGRIFFTDEDLLQSRQQWRGSWVVGPRQEFAYLLVKKICEKGTVPEQQRTRLEELAQELGPEAHFVVSRLFGERCGDRLVDWIIRENWTEVEARIRQLRHSLRWQVVKRDCLNPLRYWLPEIRRLWRRWRYPTGLSIAVVGPDAARKNTLIWHLKQTLPAAFRRTAVFQQLPGFVAWKKSRGPTTDPPEKPPRPVWLSWFKFLLRALDYGLGFLFRVRPLLARSTLVIFDRYYDDLLIGLLGHRHPAGIEPIRLTHHLLPKPDLLFVLGHADEHLLTHEQKVRGEELRQQRVDYRQLLLRKCNAMLLDGCLPPEDLARSVRDVLADYLSRRYLERRHTWFADHASHAPHLLALI